MNYDWVRRKHSRDVIWNKKENHAHAKHEAHSERHRSPSGTARTVRVATSQRLAHSHSRCRSNPKRHHIREAHAIERHLVARERNRTELRNERRANGENAYLHS